MESRENVTLAALDGLDFAETSTYDLDMTNADPFAGLGKALAHLRKQAGYKTQLLAAEAMKFDSGQLSRWENDVTRISLDNLGRLLVCYGATVADLAALLADEPAAAEPAAEEDRGPSGEELIRALTEAIRRVEGRQLETESRVDRIERGLEAAARPLAFLPRAGEK